MRLSDRYPTSSGATSIYMSAVTGLDAALAGKSDTGHTHFMSAVTGLDAALAGKSDTGHTHSMSEVVGIDAALAGKADTGHTHNYGTSTLTATTTSARLDDWYPTGWPSDGTIKVISLSANTTNKVCIISGLSGGTDGYIMTLRNNSTDNLIILENNQSSGSTSTSRFKFNGRGAYFLFPDLTVTLIHDGVEWHQFSAHPNNGHDIFDDMYSPAYAANTQSSFFQVGFGNSSGTGSMLRNEGYMNNSSGNVGLTLGTTTSGSAFIKTNPRSDIGYLTGGDSSKILYVSRIQLPVDLPTTGQNYSVHVGLCANNLSTGISVVGMLGWIANTSSSFWQCRAANVSNTIISLTTSSLSLTSDPIVLGTWFPNNLGDTVFFYSANGGKDYTVDSMFVRVVNNYGGSPVVGAQKTAGTTSRTITVDYIALSKKGGPI